MSLTKKDREIEAEKERREEISEHFITQPGRHLWWGGVGVPELGAGGPPESGLGLWWPASCSTLFQLPQRARVTLFPVRRGWRVRGSRDDLASLSRQCCHN